MSGGSGTSYIEEKEEERKEKKEKEEEVMIENGGRVNGEE